MASIVIDENYGNVYGYSIQGTFIIAMQKFSKLCSVCFWWKIIFSKFIFKFVCIIHKCVRYLCGIKNSILYTVPLLPKLKIAPKM